MLYRTSWLNNQFRYYQKKGFLPFFLSLFIISLQIQWTLSIASWEIRLGLSDLFLPFLIYLMIVQTNLNWSKLFKKFSWFFVWAAAFSAWLGFSLVKGYFETERLSSWGLFNKFLGWFILLGYFFLGACLSRDDQKKLKEIILSILFISSACVSLFSLMIGVMFNYGSHLFKVDDATRFIGFLKNPNAYGLFCVFAVLLQLPFLNTGKLFSFFLHIPIAVLNVIATVCSGSRGACLALLVGVVVCLLLKIIKFQKLLLIFACAYLILSFLNLQKTNDYLVSRRESLTHFSYVVLQQAENARFECGISQRIENTKAALRYWKENPILGIGLGQFLVKQEEDLPPNMPRLTIHSTPLWLLTETGIIGLLLFVIFFLKVLKTLVYKIKLVTGDELVKSSIAVVLGFSVASLTTEILYQRYMWFFLGIVLFQELAKDLESTGIYNFRHCERSEAIQN